MAIRDFARNIVEPYPRLFASRRGIRAPRVIKAFILYEQLQKSPDPDIIEELLSLLPAGTNASLFQTLPSPQITPSPTTTLSEADEAFDDGQFDRAFEFYLRFPPSRKTLSRMVWCVGAIGTDDARDRLLAVVKEVEPEIFDSLAPAVRTKIDSLALEQTTQASSTKAPRREDVNPWINWASNCRRVTTSQQQNSMYNAPERIGMQRRSRGCAIGKEVRRYSQRAGWRNQCNCANRSASGYR